MNGAAREEWAAKRSSCLERLGQVLRGLGPEWRAPERRARVVELAVEALEGKADRFAWVDLAQMPEWFARAVACVGAYSLLLCIPRGQRGEDTLPWGEYADERFPGWRRDAKMSQMSQVLTPCKLFYYLLMMNNPDTLYREYALSGGLEEAGSRPTASVSAVLAAPAAAPATRAEDGATAELNLSGSALNLEGSAAATEVGRWPDGLGALASRESLREIAEELAEDTMQLHSGQLPTDELAREITEEYAGLTLDELSDVIEVSSVLSADCAKVGAVADELFLGHSGPRRALVEEGLEEDDECAVPRLVALCLDAIIQSNWVIDELPEHLHHLLAQRFAETVCLESLNLDDWCESIVRALVVELEPFQLVMIPQENRGIDTLPWDTFCALRFGEDYRSQLNARIAGLLSPCRVFFLLLQRESLALQ